MARLKSPTIFHSLLYGGASALLLLDLFFLVKSLFSGNFVPIVPIVAGILLAAGLLFVVYAESEARKIDKREHRRLGRVAHQLESPLHILKEDFENLVKNSDKLPADQRMKIKQMDTKTRILLENIRDVFLMLRAETAPIATEVRTYDLCKLIDGSMSHVKDLASAHNIEITHKAHCETAPVLVDRSLLLIALNHLLENAILYSATPGIVNVAITRGQNSVRVIIQDRGIGVKDKDANSIFLPFARGDKADQFDPDGIGVGLTLAQRIIEEFSGRITWKNRQDNTGAQFEIKLPLASK